MFQEQWKLDMLKSPKDPPPPNLVPKVLEKSRAIPLLTLRACVAY